MDWIIYIAACLCIGSAGYWLTEVAIVGVFGKRLKVIVTHKDGTKESTVVRYKKGDDIDQILKEIKSDA